MDNIKKTVKNFFYQFIDDVEFEDDEDFFESGLVNSLFAMQLVLFIEKTFDIELVGEDLDIKNMNTINAIIELVNRKSEK
ncbi:acyl carrier protein [uncultured Maribacter sp.]|uniref:acyl carrier protein n=1 Tax=uncultured Maribacter sp. TaxID=431308 RepID=UPI0030EF1442|tara:strand:+ start:1664 stop:1903 length:240 start_codon:yes stop_codon:yes gene_type:complete